jgi:pyruvate dehydrogenase phosphatase
MAPTCSRPVSLSLYDFIIGFYPRHSLNEAFMIGNNLPFRARPHFKTPPYVIATPVVTHLNLDSLNPDSSEPGSKSTLRFLVLATDGLWDELSSEEVVALVGGHFAGIEGTIPKSKLQELVPTMLGAPTVEGKEMQIEKKKDDGSWVFADENISTHLIRNAFRRGDDGQLRRVLSIPAPHSRRYRDDITVTVVWWEDDSEQATEPEILKAKL